MVLQHDPGGHFCPPKSLLYCRILPELTIRQLSDCKFGRHPMENCPIVMPADTMCKSLIRVTLSPHARGR
jgi:hypothetical protein